MWCHLVTDPSQSSLCPERSVSLVSTGGSARRWWEAGADRRPGPPRGMGWAGILAGGRGGGGALEVSRGGVEVSRGELSRGRGGGRGAQEAVCLSLGGQGQQVVWLDASCGELVGGRRRRRPRVALSRALLSAFVHQVSCLVGRWCHVTTTWSAFAFHCVCVLHFRFGSEGCVLSVPCCHAGGFI